MNKIGIPKITLAGVYLPLISFSPRGKERQPHWWDVANLLTEKGGFFLTEKGGALMLEKETKVLGVKPTPIE